MRILVGVALFATSLATALTVMLPLAIYGEVRLYDYYPVIRWGEFSVCVLCAGLGLAQAIREKRGNER